MSTGFAAQILDLRGKGFCIPVWGRTRLDPDSTAQGLKRKVRLTGLAQASTLGCSVCDVIWTGSSVQAEMRRSFVFNQIWPVYQEVAGSPLVVGEDWKLQFKSRFS